MPEKPSENISKFYSALGNPYRRQIVQLLREKRKLGFKELHEALKISVGALYHHLDMLEGIVAQDSERKYVLKTREGLRSRLSVSVRRKLRRDTLKGSRKHDSGLSQEKFFLEGHF